MSNWASRAMGAIRTACSWDTAGSMTRCAKFAILTWCWWCGRVRTQESPTAPTKLSNTTTDASRHPREHAAVERTVETVQSAGFALTLRPMPCPDWPISTPRPTNTPYLNPDRVATHPFGELDRLAGPPVAIEADGVAALDVPRDADVSAHLGVWTGGHRNGQTRLTRLPLPDTEWDQGTARIGQQEANGRILLASDHIDVYHRTARIRIEARPVTDCGTLNLRWERRVAVVMNALTDQPYADWQDHELPPMPAPAAATLFGLTLTGLPSRPRSIRPSRLTRTRCPMPRRKLQCARHRRTRPTPTSSTWAASSARTSPRADPTQPGPERHRHRRHLGRFAHRLAGCPIHRRQSIRPGTGRHIPPTSGHPSSPRHVRLLCARAPFYRAHRRVAETTHAAATFTQATEPADALTDSSYGTALVELAEGATTTVTITVTAQDGTTTQDYVVRVHRAGP